MARKELGNIEGEYIKCPIWKGSTRNEIRCEAHIPDASTTVNRFRNTKNCERQRKLFCEDNWCRCEHYLAWKEYRYIDDDE